MVKLQPPVKLLLGFFLGTNIPPNIAMLVRYNEELSFLYFRYTNMEGKERKKRPMLKLDVWNEDIIKPSEFGFAFKCKKTWIYTLFYHPEVLCKFVAFQR